MAGESAHTLLVDALFRATPGMTQVERGAIAKVEQETMSGWVRARAEGKPVSIKKKASVAAIEAYLLADERARAPGFRDGVDYALQAMREPFERLEARLRQKEQPDS